jgi:hypothetical protein
MISLKSRLSWTVAALVIWLALLPDASAQSATKIAEEAGTWKVLVGGPRSIYLITQTDRAALGIAPADNGLYLYAEVPDAGLETVTVRFDDGSDYTLAVQITQDVPTYRALIANTLPPGQSPETISFIHALTAGRTATIVAGANVYAISLAGTSAAVDALNFFGKEHDLNLPPPFTAAKPYAATLAAANPATPPPTVTVPPPGQAAPSAATFQSGPPDIERNFVAIIKRYSAAYAAAPNDMAKGALRPQRAAAICALNLRSVSGWYGEVSTLSSNNEGKGVLAVTIADGLTIRTTNNSFSDQLASIQTLIPIGSNVQTQAMALKKGDVVRFSGRFGSKHSDCLEETSLTMGGSMTEPEFLFQFSDIRLVN